MLIEQTGTCSAVILLEKNDCREERFLFESVKKALKLDKNAGYTPKITMFNRKALTLVFMELVPLEKLFCFEDNDALIDAVRQLDKLCMYCEMLGDGDKVYIKTCNSWAWNILSEYGNVCDEKKNLHTVGGQDVFYRILGG